jgi:hypothetical protein
VDGAKFYLFLQWAGRSKDAGLPDARTHIENQLRKFGVPIGRKGYKIVDVHKNNKQLLNVSDEKVGAIISGGSDVVVVPFNAANASINQDCQRSVVVRGCPLQALAVCVSGPGVKW